MPNSSTVPLTNLHISIFQSGLDPGRFDTKALGSQHLESGAPQILYLISQATFSGLEFDP